MKRKGFTLIELLVVIAIIGMLLAILVPSLQNAKKMAAGSVCLANLRGMSISWYQYAENNDGKIARCNQGPDRWVDRPHSIDASGARNYTNHGSTVPEKENGIMNGVLFEYTESTKLYHCPADKRFRKNNTAGGKGPYRSYAMPDALGGLNGPETITSNNGAPSLVVKPIEKYSDFINPGGKYIFVEENYTHSPGRSGSLQMNMGYNGGVWSFWRSNVLEAWWDPIAPWHNDRTNLGFADGHGEKLVWKDQRTVWFSIDRVHPKLDNGSGDTFGCAYQPDNPDQQYMTRAFPSGR